MDAAMSDPNSDSHAMFAPDEADRPLTGRRRRPAKVALATAGIALGLAGVAGASWGALSALSSAVKPRGEIVIGRVDYPDIKDGVPALASARPAVRVIPGASAPGPSAGALQPAEPPREPIATGALAALLTEPAVAPGALSPARPVSRTLPAAATKSAAKPEPAKPDPAKPEAAKPETASSARAPAVSAAAPTVASAPAQTAAVPLPPAAPGRTAKNATPEPRPVAVATATPANAAPVSVVPPQRSLARQPAASPATASAPAAAKTPAAAPQPVNEGGRAAVAEDDSVNVFGLAVPSIGAAGRRIREGAEAFGDAVASLPGRF
jgi:hypothetical protein